MKYNEHLHSAYYANYSLSSLYITSFHFYNYEKSFTFSPQIKIKFRRL